MATQTQTIYHPYGYGSIHSGAKGITGKRMGGWTETITTTSSGGGLGGLVSGIANVVTGAAAGTFGGGYLFNAAAGGNKGVTDTAKKIPGIGAPVAGYLHGENTTLTQRTLSNSDAKAGVELGAIALTGAAAATAVEGASVVDAGADTVPLGSDVVPAATDTVQVGSDTVVVDGGADTTASTINTDLAGQGYGDVSVANPQTISPDISGGGIPDATRAVPGTPAPAAASTTWYQTLGISSATAAGTATVSNLLKHWFPGASNAPTQGPASMPAQISNPSGGGSSKNGGGSSSSSAPASAPWFSQAGGKTTLTSAGLTALAIGAVGLILAKKYKVI